MINRKTAALVALLCAAPWFTPADAATIYVYMRADGSRLITDHQRYEPGYQLVKTYGTGDHYASTGPVYSSIKPVESQYDDLIQKVAQSTRLDPALLKSVMQVESAFKSRAISRKGAQGLMQLMPGTAQRYGVGRVFDPHANTLGGARYLRDLLHQFQGDTRLALAGYNAGENAVLRYGGVPPYRETQKYVEKVLTLYERYQELN